MSNHKHLHEQLMTTVNDAVFQERLRQNEKWGVQRHHIGTWLAILGEEFGEACQAAQVQLGLANVKPTDADNLYEELLHVSAVAAAIAEQVLESSIQQENVS